MNPIPVRLVVKFGGTSMGDLRAMEQSARVTLLRHARVVVVSAMSGVTNRLVHLAQAAEAGDAEAIQAGCDALKTKHHEVMQALQLSRGETAPVDALLLELRSLLEGIRLIGECSPRSRDAVLSLGERLSSNVFTGVLNRVLESEGQDTRAEWFDVRNVMRTDENFGHATPLLPELERLTTELLRPAQEKQILVTQGFIGRTSMGATTTLGRGGSDYSAALLAEALESSAVEIWTDVPGIATTDPRLTSRARIISEISFNEAAEAALFGAKVLHPATVLPAIRKNIPVFVASTFAPEKDGTWVTPTVEAPPLVRAIALKRRQVLLTLSTPEMLYATGFLSRIFSIFAEFGISVDNITTSQVSIALTLDDATLLKPQFLKRLDAVANVSREENLALVSLIGNKINHTPGLAARVFHVLQDINVRMIGLGASEHQFCLLVSESAAEEVVKLLHADLLEQPATTV